MFYLFMVDCCVVRAGMGDIVYFSLHGAACGIRSFIAQLWRRQSGRRRWLYRDQYICMDFYLMIVFLCDRSSMHGDKADNYSVLSNG